MGGGEREGITIGVGEEEVGERSEKGRNLGRHRENRGERSERERENRSEGLKGREKLKFGILKKFKI